MEEGLRLGQSWRGTRMLPPQKKKGLGDAHVHSPQFGREPRGRNCSLSKETASCFGGVLIPQNARLMDNAIQGEGWGNCVRRGRGVAGEWTLNYIMSSFFLGDTLVIKLFSPSSSWGPRFLTAQALVSCSLSLLLPFFFFLSLFSLQTISPDFQISDKLIRGIAWVNRAVDTLPI